MSVETSIETFDLHLNNVLDGGIPAPSFNILAGQPGTGKTIFCQQLLFHHITTHPDSSVLYLTTLSEPPAKILRFMRGFTFFHADLIGSTIHIDDIGGTLRKNSLEEVLKTILSKVQKVDAEVLVIDSFKAIRDFTEDKEVFRKFIYRLAIRLYNEGCTAILVGEYDTQRLTSGAEFAIADGIISLTLKLVAGEYQRTLQVMKLRGRNAWLGPIPFIIVPEGITALTSGLSNPVSSELRRRTCEPTGITGLDALLNGGLCRGRAIILSGVSGTGKTTLSLQILSNASKCGQRGLYYSFEEPAADLLTTAASFGWELHSKLESGLIRLVHIPQTAIRIEENLKAIRDDIEEFQPDWVVLDSFSLFLHRVKNDAIIREKTYQVKNMVYQANAVGLLLSDIPADAPEQFSRFGVEETIGDGTIRLSSKMKHTARHRFIEVYKMRQVNHVTGQHRMEISGNGIEVMYIPPSNHGKLKSPSPLTFSPVQPLFHDEIRYGSAWLVRGQAGIGKSTLALQFAAEGLQNGESVLFITADTIQNGLEKMNIQPEQYQKKHKFHLLDGYSGSQKGLNLTDGSGLLYVIARTMESYDPPLRIIFDSVTPLAASFNSAQFIDLIQQKNRLLRQPGVVILDTHLHENMDNEPLPELLNVYDIVMDLFSTAGADFSEGTENRRYLRMRKSRGGRTDRTAVPFSISAEQGIVIDAP